MTTPAVADLVAVINEEIAVLTQLLARLEDTQRAIVHSDAAAIEPNVVAQEQLAAAARQLEARRTQIVAQLSHRLADCPGDANLARLVQLLRDDGGAELGRMRATLVEIVGRIRQVSAHNGFLIRQSLRYTQRCLEILTGPAPDRGMYGQFGRARSGAAARSVLNRTA